MYQSIITILFSVLFALPLHAAPDTTTIAPRLRISILNCKPGEEVWETFGHACIRIVDSSQTGAEHDKIYNYGFFETSEDKTLWEQAFTGRVIDLLDTITYDLLMLEYTTKKRGITELVLNLTPHEQLQVYRYLRDNLRREKKYYEFDTFYDNCSTRIRDLFYNVFGPSFVMGQVLPPHSRLTFRDVTATTQCPAQQKHWFGFAVNMLYASRIDKVMTNNEAMFSPHMLQQGLKKATINGRPIAGQTIEMLPQQVIWAPQPNYPLYISYILLFLAIIAVLSPMPTYLNKFITTSILLVPSALGCIVLYAWLLDGEPAWKNNYNILWALPTSFLIPFLPSSFRRLHAILALISISIALVVHTLRIQVLPLHQFAPLLCAIVILLAYQLKTKHKNVNI